MKVGHIQHGSNEKYLTEDDGTLPGYCRQLLQKMRLIHQHLPFPPHKKNPLKSLENHKKKFVLPWIEGQLLQILSTADREGQFRNTLREFREYWMQRMLQEFPSLFFFRIRKLFQKERKKEL